MKFVAKLLKKAYGYDQGGTVVDAEQNNVRDKNNNNRNPEHLDMNLQNTELDGTMTPGEYQEMAAAKEKLNPL